MKSYYKIAGSATLTLLIHATIGFGQVIKFDKTTHDFGSFQKPKEGVAKCEFTFTNTGDAPLVINKVIATCGCTTPKWTSEPVPAGGKGSIQVTYNTSTAGSFSKSINIYSNSKNGNVKLTITGKVEPYKEDVQETYPVVISGGIRINKKQLNYQNLTHTESRTLMLDVYNDNTEPTELSFANIPKELTVTAVPEKINPKQRGSIILSYDGRKNKNWGRQKSTFHLIANNSLPAEKNKITITANLVENLSKLSAEEKKKAPMLAFSTRNLLFDKVKINSKHKERITLTNKGKETLIIHAINIDCENMEVKPEKMSIQPGKSIKVKLSYNPKKQEDITNQTIAFITNAPNATNGIVEIEVLPE